MAFIKDMYRDEIRDGWLVKAGIKKSWNKMLEIWQEVDRICRKYRIKYWAYAGTLLGAVRHGGFVPWDTDMDLCMMRPEYNIFCDAVERELVRDDSIFETERKNFNNYRIALKTTSMLGTEKIQDRELNKSYGMMVEIYPLDLAQDGTPLGDFSTLKLHELLSCIIDANYLALKERIKNNKKTFNDLQVMENFRALPEEAKQEFYSNYAALLFDKSKKIAWLEDTLDDSPKIYEKDWFRETIYLPFETVQLPVPVDCEKVLDARYGDWHKFIYDHTFRIGRIYSPDISYREILERVDFDFMFPKEEDAST